MKTYTQIYEEYCKENNSIKFTNDEMALFIKGYRHCEYLKGNDQDESGNKFFLEGRRVGISETLGAIFFIMTRDELLETKEAINQRLGDTNDATPEYYQQQRDGAVLHVAAGDANRAIIALSKEGVPIYRTYQTKDVININIDVQNLELASDFLASRGISNTRSH